MKTGTNRPEGMPTTRAWMWFWVGVSVLLLDVCLWQNMMLEVLK